jgi:hypothetical protein
VRGTTAAPAPVGLCSAAHSGGGGRGGVGGRGLGGGLGFRPAPAGDARCEAFFLLDMVMIRAVAAATMCCSDPFFL